MKWLEQSIMHTRGVAKGQVGVTHELGEERQGTFHYTIGPYSEPVMVIKPGDRVELYGGTFVVPERLDQP